MLFPSCIIEIDTWDIRSAYLFPSFQFTRDKERILQLNGPRVLLTVIESLESQN